MNSDTPRTDVATKIIDAVKITRAAKNRAYAAFELILDQVTKLAVLADDQRRIAKADAEDAKRWQWARDHMVHQQCGPSVGWTLDALLPGDDPDSAIDAARKRK